MRIKVKRMPPKKEHMAVTVIFSPRFISMRELRALSRDIRSFVWHARRRALGRDIHSVRVFTCAGTLVLNMLFKHAYSHRGAYKKYRQTAKEIAARVHLVLKAFDRLCAMQETRPKRKRSR